MQAERGAILAAWWSAKWARLSLVTRRDIERRQARLWREMVPIVARTPAIAHLAGKGLDAFPVVTPADMRADFERWNTLGLTRDQCRAAAAEAERGGRGGAAPGVAAGFSTGTTGERGVFLTTAAERSRYLGLALARLLPASAMMSRWTVVLILRANNSLYADVDAAGRFDFRFLPLDMDPAARAEAVDEARPGILIAPAHVLADLARRRPSALAAAKRLFWGAEPMGAAERDWIAEKVGVRPDPIYQATEGFLGAPCREGTLHLNEDALVVELEPVDGTTAFRPIVTDLHRRTQPMVRVRLDDLVEPLAGRCRCGSPLRAIRPVEGRVGDLWRWPDRIVRPGEAWTAMETALGPEADWRAEASVQGVELWGATAAAREAVHALVGGRPVALRRGGAGTHYPKRRRVRWRP